MKRKARKAKRFDIQRWAFDRSCNFGELTVTAGGYWNIVEAYRLGYRHGRRAKGKR